MTYHYADPDHRWIAGPSGQTIPADPANADYAALLATAEPIGAFVPPPPTADDIRAEASRRMQAMLGARDAAHVDLIVANATREAVRLQNIRLKGGTWTPEQSARIATLEAADAALEAIRSVSNAMEASPPSDYTSDSHWLH